MRRFSLLSVAVFGCSLLPAAVSGCGPGCTGTTLTQQPVGRGPDGTLTFSATLTSGSQPLGDVNVNFMIFGTGSRGDLGQSFGTYRTDSNGTASVTYRSTSLKNETDLSAFTGWQAKFSSVFEIHGVNYCSVVAHSSVV